MFKFFLKYLFVLIVIILSVSCSPVLKEKIATRINKVEIRKNNKPRKPFFKPKVKKDRNTRRKKGKEFSLYRGERDNGKKNVEKPGFYKTKKRKRKSYTVSRSGGPKFSPRPSSEMATKRVKRGRKTYSKQQKKKSKGENRTSYKAVKLAKKKPKLRKEPQMGLWGGKQKRSKKMRRKDVK